MQAGAEPNIDPAEIDKFSRLAAHWWDPRGAFRPLHEINPLRLEFIQARSPLAGRRALDVGCGGGILAEAMAAAGAAVTGIDMGAAPLEAARLHALASGVELTYRQVTAEALAAAAPGGWEIVTCMELLEHVPHPASVVAACAALVKPGGRVYFSTISRTPKAFLLAIVGAEYLLKLLPKGTHKYENFIRPSELCGWAEDAGLVCDNMTGLHYHPLTGVYTLGPGVAVNYLLSAARPGE